MLAPLPTYLFPPSLIDPRVQIVKWTPWGHRPGDLDPLYVLFIFCTLHLSLCLHRSCYYLEKKKKKKDELMWMDAVSKVVSVVVVGNRATGHLKVLYRTINDYLVDHNYVYSL